MMFLSSELFFLLIIIIPCPPHFLFFNKNSCNLTLLPLSSMLQRREAFAEFSNSLT